MAIVSRRTKLLSVAAASALALVACGGNESSYSLDVELQRFNAQGASEQRIYRSVVEAMPNNSFFVDGKRVESPSDLFVVGDVVAVAGSPSYAWPRGPQVEGEPDTRVEYPFNDERSDISTVELLVRSSTIVDAEGLRDAASEEIRFALSLPTPVDLKSIEEQLTAAPVAVLLVRNERSTFDYDPDVYGVLRYGEMLGVVSGDSVTFPHSPIDRATVDDKAKEFREAAPIPLTDFLVPQEVRSVTDERGVIIAEER